MLRLSIIIPYLGNPKRLEDTLVSVLENRPNDCEVLAVLAQPYDNPYKLDDEVCFCRAADGTGLAELMNLGIATSRAPVVHLLTCGAEVREGWADVAMAHFRDPQVASVAPLAIDLDHRDRVLAAGVQYTPAGRIRLRGNGGFVGAVEPRAGPVLAPYPAAAFYRKTALESLGGFAASVADWLAVLDTGLTLRYLGYRTILEPASVVAASSGHQPRPAAFREALERERFFWRWGPWVADSSPLMHLLATVGDCVQGIRDFTILAQVAGRFAGICPSGNGHHGVRLRELSDRC